MDKEYLIALVKADLGRCQDNLFRAQATQKRDPGWKSGNGEPIEEVIEDYKEGLYRAEFALKELAK